MCDFMEYHLADTDSFLFEAETSDIFRDLHTLRSYFDFSKYPPAHPLYNLDNKDIPGLFKDEAEGLPIRKFTGLRSKCYSIQLADGSEKKAAAGTKQAIARKAYRQQDYDDVLRAIPEGRHEEAIMKIKQNTIRAYGHNLYNIAQDRIGLSAYDDKRYILGDGVHTRALGHFLNESE